MIDQKSGLRGRESALRYSLGLKRATLAMTGWIPCSHRRPLGAGLGSDNCCPRRTELADVRIELCRLFHIADVPSVLDDHQLGPRNRVSKLGTHDLDWATRVASPQSRSVGTSIIANQAVESVSASDCASSLKPSG